jgi:glycine oxidase
MATHSSDVVIVGGGITGMAVAYYLGKAGVKTTVIEKDSVGSHASGFAYGGLSPLGGAGIPGVMAEVAQETGVNIEFRQRPTLTLAFNDDEVQRLQAPLVWQQQQAGYVEP